jgi:hypothetical protein
MCVAFVGRPGDGRVRSPIRMTAETDILLRLSLVRVP